MPWTTRYNSAAVVPAPNGPPAVAAKARTVPRLKVSLGGPTLTRGMLRGHEPGRADHQACLHQRRRFRRPRDTKSMTREPSSAISTFDGLRSRCTTPAG